MAYGGKGDVPIVQGEVVQGTPFGYNPSQQQYAPAPSSNNYNVEENYGGDFNGQKGQQQPKQFNDVGFAVAFYAHLAVMAYFLIAATASSAGDGDQGSYEYSGIIYCVVVCGIFSIGLSTVALGFMMKFATELVKMALFFSIGCSLAVGILGLMAGEMIMGVCGLLSFLVGCCYAYVVWSRIPFAAANLNTALSAVRANLGMAVVAYIVLAMALLWSVWWSVAAGGMVNSYGNGVMFVFLVSYFWTHQVLQNTLHVTSAGVIGTWWFVPSEASSFCSAGLSDSFTRAATYSFGSICFGSLLVALVQALRHLNRMLRDNEDFNFLVCIVDCILACIEDIIEYLNKWAYVYVGLYGYSYLEAGKNVITLFQNRGWSSIIADDLADNVLFMMSIGIGLFTGLVGLIVASLDKNLFADIGYDNAGTIGFIVGFLVGFIMASILMSVVGSAVNTVIVCFAEAPAEFEQNHPMLSMEMRGAWRQAYPNECGNI